MELSRLVCNFCRARFSRIRVTPIRHYQDHIKNLKNRLCRTCFKVFATPYVKDRHQRTAHERPNPITCECCGRVFFCFQT